MKTYWLWCVLALYGGASVFYVRDFMVRKNVDRMLSKGLFTAGLSLHLLFLVLFALSVTRLPVATLSESISMFVWLTGAVYWLLEQRLRERSMGTFILPVLTILMVFAAATFDPDEPIRDILKDVQFEVHVLLMLMAYGGFTLAFISSLLHALLNRELQKGELGVFYQRLPSLPFFEEISHLSVDIGLGFMTVGLLIGVFNALKVGWQSNLLDPKLIAAFLTWLIYLFHFVSRKFLGWRGQRAAVVSVAGYTWLLFSFLVLSMFSNTVHRFI